MSKEAQKPAAASDAAAEVLTAEAAVALTKENETLKAKIKALQTISAATATDENQAAEEKLTDKQREFTASWEEPNSKDNSKTIKVSGKGRLKDVAVIRLAGKAYTQKEFLSDPKAKAKALRMDHLLVDKLK
jgi:hypothetical protein